MENNYNFLFITLDGGGNVPPVLGLAKRLLDRGHAVNVLSEPCLQLPVTSLGLNFISFKEHFTREDRTEDICQDWNDSVLKKAKSFQSEILKEASKDLGVAELERLAQETVEGKSKVPIA